MRSHWKSFSLVIIEEKQILGCKIVYHSEWIMIPNKAFQNIGLHSYHSKIYQMVDCGGDWQFRRTRTG